MAALTERAQEKQKTEKRRTIENRAKASANECSPRCLFIP